MEPGSTPDTTVGGGQPSLPSSADNAGVSQPSTPQDNQPAPNGDLLGRLTERMQSGQPVTDAPSQTTPEPTSTPQAQPENQGQPTGDSADDDLTRWASSQGIDLNNPTPEQTQKLAQRLRDTQKWAHERANNNQQFDQIQQDLSDENEDPLEKEVRILRNQNARRDFWDSHPEDRHYEKDMITEVYQMSQDGDKAGAEYYSTPQGWKHLLAIVKTKGNSPDQIRDEAAEAAAKTERENLARAQQAAGPMPAATSSAPQPQVSQDEAIGKMSQTEYNEWRKTHNPFSR
jgi:hypothetical protein